MTATKTLPNGPDMPILLRRLKFVFRPLEYIEDFAKIYGDTFTLKSPKGNYAVYFSHPQALEQIFTADSTNLGTGGGNIGLEFLLGQNSLLALSGERHQRQRQLLAPPFHGEKMRIYGETIQEITHQVCDSWLQNKAFNIRDTMQEIALRVILRVVFGFDEGSRLQELQKLLSSVLEFLGSPLMSAGFFFTFLQKDLGAWSPWGRMMLQIQKIDELIYAHIKERKVESYQPESYQNRQDILSLMMFARYDDGQPMSDTELRDELMTLLVAGHETTASALVWALYWIDRSPQIREKLQKELLSLDGNTEPTTIAKLPYLTAVSQESLRMYPILANAFVRFATSPIEIMGYQLPKGTMIIPSIYMAHHRQEVYPQPKQFKPERFLERQFSPYEFLPFGGGSRRCLGMAFAQYEMKIVLATILSKFQVSMVDKRAVRPVRRGLTLAAPAGMKVIATPQT
ncbi:MAG: cytochrome P450 [Scytonematopsis contorta HA4267-MV1]|jgi:cytochrome P450|nr:cytochrome P450 [Scytonematopsis contorta HA4267-MV1]